METKLYVGNLSYTTSETDLQALFEKAGGLTQESRRLLRESISRQMGADGWGCGSSFVSGKQWRVTCPHWQTGL